MFDDIVEERIKEAIRNGDFANLPSNGKPINLDYWASLPQEMRLGYMLLKNAGYAPEEVQLLKEIGELREQLATCVNQDEKKVISRKLQEVQVKFNLIMESRKRERY